HRKIPRSRWKDAVSSERTCLRVAGDIFRLPARVTIAGETPSMPPPEATPDDGTACGRESVRVLLVIHRRGANLRHARAPRSMRDRANLRDFCDNARVERMLLGRARMKQVVLLAFGLAALVGCSSNDTANNGANDAGADHQTEPPVDSSTPDTAQPDA